MDDLTLKIDTGAPVEVPAFEPYILVEKRFQILQPQTRIGIVNSAT
jgi:hypothetical protein